LIALTKGALADFAISHGEPDPEEQVFPNAWDPAVISYLVLIVVLPINCCLESKSGRRDIDSARKYSGIANGRENERRKDGKWACTTLGVSWSKRGPTPGSPRRPFITGSPIPSLSCGWPCNGVSLQKTPTAMEVVGTAMLATRFGLLIEASK